MLFKHTSGIIKDINVDPRNRDLRNKGKKTTTRLSPIGYWSKSSSVSWYFGIGQDSGKIQIGRAHV